MRLPVILNSAVERIGGFAASSCHRPRSGRSTLTAEISFPLNLIVVLVFFILAAGIDTVTAAPGKKFADNIPPEVQLQPNLEYVTGGGSAQNLDLYLPPTKSGLLPVVVYVHGGGWSSCTKDDWHPSFHDLLIHGIAVANINYRLSGQAPFPAQIEDCKAAVRWVRAHAKEYHLDPDHIGIWGHSAGGHLAALTGVTNQVKKLEGNGGNADVSSSVQAACDWSGPVDLVKIVQDGRAANAVLWDFVVKLMGGEAGATKEALAEATPGTYVSAGSVPFLIMHGELDKIVPLDQCKALDAALKKAGAETTLIIVPNEGHGICKPDDLARVTAFFDQHLKSVR